MQEQYDGFCVHIEEISVQIHKCDFRVVCFGRCPQGQAEIDADGLEDRGVEVVEQHLQDVLEEEGQLDSREEVEADDVPVVY